MMLVPGACSCLCIRFPAGGGGGGVGGRREGGLVHVRGLNVRCLSHAMSGMQDHDKLTSLGFGSCKRVEQDWDKLV